LAFSLQRGQFYPKFQVEGLIRPPPAILLVSETRINVFSCDIIIWAELYFVLKESTRLTDGQTELSWLDRVGILCSAVKCFVDYHLSGTAVAFGVFGILGSDVTLPKILPQSFGAHREPGARGHLSPLARSPSPSLRHCRSDSAVTPSEKVQLTLIVSPLRAFQ